MAGETIATFMPTHAQEGPSDHIPERGSGIAPAGAGNRRGAMRHRAKSEEKIEDEMIPSDQQRAGGLATLAAKIAVVAVVFPLLAAGLGSLAGCAREGENRVDAPADRVTPRIGHRGGRD